MANTIYGFDHGILIDRDTGLITIPADLSVLAPKTANTVLAGPVSGSPAAATFRTLVAGDIPSGPSLIGNGTAQYQILVTGSSPFAPAFSGFLLDGTVGGKTVLNVSNGSTLTLTSGSSFGLTVPATGTAALLEVSNLFTASQHIKVNGGSAAIQLTSVTNGNFILGYRSSGTVLSPTTVGTISDLLLLDGFGYGNNAYWQGGRIALRTAGSWSDTSYPTEIYFSTVASGSTALTQQMVIRPDGNVGIGVLVPTAKLQIVGGSDQIQTIIRANATQTTNLTEWQTSAGDVLASVSGAGNWGLFSAPVSTTILTALKTGTGAGNLIGGSFIARKSQGSGTTFTTGLSVESSNYATSADSPSTYLRGSSSVITVSATSPYTVTVPSAINYLSNTPSLSGTGTKLITSAYGFYALTQGATGITNA